MSKAALIIGMGSGLSMGLAKKFGSEGFQIGMVSRTTEKLAGYVDDLSAAGIESTYAPADVGSEKELLAACESLRKLLPQVDVLLYNAVDYRYINILEEKVDDLSNGFKVSVANALTAVRFFREDLKETKGAAILTGGGLALNPHPDFATIALGKAGIRSLTTQLHQALKDEFYVGSVLVNGMIDPKSEQYSPDAIAAKFWELYNDRSTAEIIY